ncbi:hypothetical protein M405DRAFT_622540 [Rhizopogon salebrosus TDB-379]|nr:hypothetical protein M405DRAFT_622540 [Rhizopogon salebrosus TDB-379]
MPYLPLAPCCTLSLPSTFSRLALPNVLTTTTGTGTGTGMGTGWNFKTPTKKCLSILVFIQFIVQLVPKSALSRCSLQHTHPPPILYLLGDRPSHLVIKRTT